MRRSRLLLGLLLAARVVLADTTTLDFESLSEGTPVTNQFPGLVFTSATVITAGSSLNELEFPPHSGTNVVFDDSGPISIAFSFAQPVVSFGGFFTYTTPLTLDAFDSANNLVASATSAFSSNLALSGDAGSSPNEFLQVSFNGIASLTVTGDPGGSSFTLDDATVTTTSSGTIPEPASIFLLLTAALFGVRVISNRR